MAYRLENGTAITYCFDDIEIQTVKTLPAYKAVSTETAGVLGWAILVPQESAQRFFESALVLAGIQLLDR